MPLISHEVPATLLQGSLSFNDYDYAFAHLYSDSRFKEFYLDCVKNGRKVLLDNSAFELGTGVFDAFGPMIEELRPTWYVVPDARHNASETINLYNRFSAQFKGLPGIPIGAIQGETFDELVGCYRYMLTKAPKIGIPFDSKGYDTSLPPWERRPAFLAKLKETPYWKDNPLHLFGTYSAEEFTNPIYSSIHFETVDTSNPVTAAAEGWRYDQNGTRKKSNLRLMVDDPPVIDIDLLLYNVRAFRKIIDDNCI